MSNLTGPTQEAEESLRKVMMSFAVVKFHKAYEKYRACIKAGRDPEVCWLEAFWGIYTIYKPFPDPGDPLKFIYKNLKESYDILSAKQKEIDELIKKLKPVI